jgi:hypothetical protein
MLRTLMRSYNERKPIRFKEVGSDIRAELEAASALDVGYPPAAVPAGNPVAHKRGTIRQSTHVISSHDWNHLGSAWAVAMRESGSRSTRLEGCRLGCAGKALRQKHGPAFFWSGYPSAMRGSLQSASSIVDCEARCISVVARTQHPRRSKP